MSRSGRGLLFGLVLAAGLYGLAFRPAAPDARGEMSLGLQASHPAFAGEPDSATAADPEPAESEPDNEQPPFRPASESPKPFPFDGGEGRTVYHVHLTDVVDLGVAPYLERVIHEAENNGAAAVILEINTPGGRVGG